MPYLTLGLTTQLTIKVPTAGSTDWAEVMKTDTFQKIAEHNHTGSGTGAQLGAGSILANAISGAKLRLDNNEYLRARDAANSADVEIVKVNASDKAEFGVDIAVLDLTNNTYLRSRNNADSAYVSICKVNTSDEIEIGATIVSATVSTLTSPISNNTLINASGSATLTDNTSNTDAGVTTLTANQTCTIRVKAVRNGSVSIHTIELDQDNATINEIYSGDDTGITFSIASDQLQYTTTNTGFDATLTYTVIKE